MDLEIEKERLALEKEKFNEERRFQRQKLYIESRIKRQQIEIEKRRAIAELNKPWWTSSIPWLAPTLSAFVAAMTLIFTNTNTNREKIEADKSRTFELKQQRESQQLEFDNNQAALKVERETVIILQATKDVPLDQARNNLLFFSKLGYIEASEKKLNELFDQGLTPATGNTSSELLTRTDTHTLGSGELMLTVFYGDSSLGVSTASLVSGVKFDISGDQKPISLGDSNEIRGDILRVRGVVTIINPNVNSTFIKLTLEDSEYSNEFVLADQNIETNTVIFRFTVILK